MATPYCVVYVTAPAGAPGARLARKILESRAAACVNIISSVKSVYWWKEKIERAAESLLIIKTRTSALKKLETVVRRHHPYSVPELVALPITFGHKPYLRWLGAEVKSGPW